MKPASTPVPHLHAAPGDPRPRPARTPVPLLASLVAFGAAFGAGAQQPAAQPAVERKAVEQAAVARPAVAGDVSGGSAGEAPPGAPATDGRGTAGETAGATAGEAADLDGVEFVLALDPAPLPDTSKPQAEFTDTTLELEEPARGRLAEWLEPLRVSLKHELSYKVAAPQRLVNNRSAVRVEYPKLLARNLYVRFDTKLNLHWRNDHRAKAHDDDLFGDLITREAFLQSSFWNTSFRFGYQILPWGVSEGGAITDEVSPRNTSEFFFVSLEESRIGQPMLAVDHFGKLGQWTGFFVPRPSYNRYPDRGSEYDIPGAFDVPEPRRRWDDPDDYEYGLRWQRTFGKSDVSLMSAALVDNDYVVRKQRFSMYGLTANIAKGNLLLRAEAALKKPKALFARAADGRGTRIVTSDQFDTSLGFDYTPGGRSLVYSAEIVWNRLLDWDDRILGRVENEYAFVGSVSNRFLNDDLALTWLMIYNRTYRSHQHKFLSSYKIDDNSTLYCEAFYPSERDERSGSWPYRDQKQLVIRYQYQF